MNTLILGTLDDRIH